MALVGCNKQEPSPPAEMNEQPAAEAQVPAEQAMPAESGIPQVTGDTVTTASGLKYVVITEGTGPAPQAGNLVGAHYTGWLLDGTKFDSSRDRGTPLQFPIGQGRVIRGWDEGLMAMKAGGRRLLIIPPDLAYGERGTPNGPIPPNATLIFDVELMSVTPPATTP